tara:strand:+ start:375 stop:896 length:522 start_codon:yes stop_codon:yes gene_type:complete
MSLKKEKILKSAIQLFSELGYSSTSTSKIAKSAGVSEGLIFRHFGNKEGLLNALIEQIKEKTFHSYAPILAKSEPKEFILGILSLPFGLEEEDYHAWRLIYSLKWQTESYDRSISDPIRHELQKAFAQLNYKDPEAEAEGLMIIIDGIATAVLLRKPKNLTAIKQSILSKYNL